MYRPLTPESLLKVNKVLLSAQVDIDKHFALQPGKPTRLIVHEEHGITFLERSRVLSALDKRSLRRFDAMQLKEDLADYNSREGSEIELPIGVFDWCGAKRRKLAGHFAASAECQVLTSDTEVLDELLCASGAAKLSTREPEHVEMGRYHCPGVDIETRTVQQSKISEIVSDNFEKAGLAAVRLGHLIMGATYSQPFEIAH